MIISEWNIKEHQMHLQPDNLVENGSVKMGNGTVRREVEEKVTVLSEIDKHQKGGSTGIKIGQAIEADKVNHVNNDLQLTLIFPYRLLQSSS